ncbi:hypothetical protein WMY93_002171 [Mugilogobius chulae]|uniref:Uncharacterized protein n=1 Tax=Mugilogobius chulae TaxID=88201 RepID=A0AAW0PTM2_9GOBI
MPAWSCVSYPPIQSIPDTLNGSHVSVSVLHGPVLKLKTSQFSPGQHPQRTCDPLSIFGMLWIGGYDHRIGRHDHS